MNVGELFIFLIALTLCGIGIAALTLLVDVMQPRLVRRARNTAEKMPLRSGIVGFINLLSFSIVSVAVLSIAQEAEGDADAITALLRLFAAVILIGLVSFIAVGIAAIARWVGERLTPEAAPRRQIVNGVVVLELACLAPVVGWFLVPLVTILVGYGAVMIAMVWRRDA